MIYFCGVKNIVLIVTFFILCKPLSPIVEYVVNYDYISQVLCVNKEKPQMQCNGKCHLMKELAKEFENEKPIQNNKKIASSDFEVLFFQEIISLQFTQGNVHDKAITLDFYDNQYYHLNSSNVFHPPIFIC